MIVGKRISERYKIIKYIGGGGMSNVYLAQDIILDREVAIKILRYDFTNEAELHRRFQREALSATSLTHPNIVSVYDVGEDGDLHYIVMEYIEGKTLKQYIQENSPVSPARSVNIMKQLTSAIAHAHDNGIVHRDIKPQNILVDASGNVKITDFGIATTLSATSYTQTNSVIGTVHYLSPEQARGGIATNQSDLYALGIVFYELLIGELPFSGESAVAIALKHLQTETPSVRSFDATIPQSIENIVLKATAKDLDHRYPNAQEMERDLETALSLARVNEPKYTTPIDEGATRVMPAIKTPVEMKPKQPEQVKKQPVKVEPPTEPKKPKKKKWPLVLMAIIFLAVVGFLGYIMLNPAKIAIADVADLSVGEATKTLVGQGFVMGEPIMRHSDTIEKDVVIGTNPAAGRSHVKGTEVRLIVSLGDETTAMKDYVGKQLDQVLSIIEPKVASVESKEIFSDQEAGTIIEQTPAADEDVILEETHVKFVVSKGKALVKVADLSGYNKSALEEYERNSGLKVVTNGEMNSETVPIGHVVSQEPATGTELAEGSEVTVMISKGPAEKHVKFYVKDVEIPYTITPPEQTSPDETEPETEGEVEEGLEPEETPEPIEPIEPEPPVEQTVRIYIQDKQHTMAEPVEILKITQTTKYRIQLEIEEGTKAAYRISVDNNIIADETVPYDY